MRVGRLAITLRLGQWSRPDRHVGECGCVFWSLGPVTVEWNSPSCVRLGCGLRDCACPEEP